MKNLSKYIVAFSLVISISSCELLFMEANPDTSPTAIFDEAWTFVDREYSFLEYKGIDWDSVYQVYRPLVNDEMEDEALFDVIADMLFVLRDGHVNLKVPFDRSRNWTWFLEHPKNFSYDLLERKYWKSEEQFISSFIVYDFGDVGYMHYSSFSSDISDAGLDYILEKFKDHKGIIIDVRDNGGGAVSNVTKLASRFTDTEVLGARSRYRNGPGHNDFSEWEDLMLKPHEDDSKAPIRFTKPVVVLTNRSCYSATTFFTTYMSALPNVTTVGDWTGGGGGAPSFTELANGWILRVSNTVLAMPDGFNVEHGVPVEVAVDMDETDIANGLDSILEKALELIRN
jgi:hypothetical protein